MPNYTNKQTSPHIFSCFFYLLPYVKFNIGEKMCVSVTVPFFNVINLIYNKLHIGYTFFKKVTHPKRPIFVINTLKIQKNEHKSVTICNHL